MSRHPSSDPMESLKRQMLKGLLYSRKEIDDWLAGRAFPFSKYDPELGYLHIDRDFQEGIDGSVCTYRYGPCGARRRFAHADAPCRINSYGNSFTSCEQVSDGETWQEVLASHLGEPIRNYGIGGYSVYQAYLRMRREEAAFPAPYIIFNIYDDDHYRNLHSWQRLRFTVNRKAANPPVPHLQIDPESGHVSECANPCPTPESLYELCALDSAYAIFHNTYTLNRYAELERPGQHLEVEAAGRDFEDPEYTDLALRSTQWIIGETQSFAAAQQRTILYVLSYGAESVDRRIRHGSRFDQTLVDFLTSRKIRFVDLLEAHVSDYAAFNLPIDDYLKRYYIGHYNPMGNAFCAAAVKSEVVRMLDPPPPAYAPGAFRF